MKKISLGALILAGLLVVNAYAQSSGTITVGHQERTYYYEAPSGPSPPEGWPVIFMFHGALQQGRAWFWLNRFKAFKDKALQSGYYVIAPNGLSRDEGSVHNVFANIKGPRWNTEDMPRIPASRSADYGNDDLNFIDALLREVERRTELDADQVFFTGFSSGAGLTMLSAVAFTTRIRAASINSGGYLGDMHFDLPAEGHPPMMINHGRLDFVVRPEFSIRYYRDLANAGIETTLNLARMRGHAWLSIFDEDVLDWFDDHK